MTPDPGKRAVILGGTRVGKSTLLDLMVQRFVRMHPDCEVLLADTKPRFRAEQTADGFDTEHLYRKATPGPIVPGSFVVDLTARRPFGRQKRGLNLFDPPGGRRRIAIAQTDRAADHPLVLRCIEVMFERADGRVPRLVVVDEGHDFFLRNGYPKYGSDAIIRVSRAGGERMLGLWFGSQRPKGIPGEFGEYAEDWFVFQLNNRKHAAGLADLGWPGDDAPDTPHVFKFWRRGWGRAIPCRLEVPPTYLAQLPKT